MSVIDVDGSGKVWGASSSLIYSMILFCISEVGERKYLMKFKESYDDGYRCIDLCENSIDEVMEFRGLVAEYLALEIYGEMVSKREHKLAVRKNLLELVAWIDRSVDERRMTRH